MANRLPYCGAVSRKPILGLGGSGGRLKQRQEFLVKYREARNRHEGADDEDAHGDGLGTVEDVGGHEGAVFSEGVGLILDIAPCFKVAFCDLEVTSDSAPVS